jgi:hypothetical protein
MRRKATAMTNRRFETSSSTELKSGHSRSWMVHFLIPSRYRQTYSLIVFRPSNLRFCVHPAEVDSKLSDPRVPARE